MSRFEDCEVCGERYHNEYIDRYTTETIVGTENDTEVIIHCIECKPNKQQRKKQ